MNSIINALRGISFFCLVAICKAIADTLADHFDTSIFKTLNKDFWNKTISAEKAFIIPGTKYKLDAWHLTNSIAITCTVLSMIYYRRMLPQGFLFTICEVGIYGILSIVVFNIFYNKILRRK